MPFRTWRGAACALLCAAACTSPAPRPGPAAGGESEAGLPLLPLLQPGRQLEFRGRSVLEQSAPDLAPAPRVGVAFSSLRLLAVEEGALLLVEETEAAVAESESASQLSRPRERRRQVFRVDRRTGRVSLEEQTLAPRRAQDYGQPRTLAFTDDGFGLNAAARGAAGLATLLVPPEQFTDLVAGRTVRLPLDFYLVVVEPLADREVRVAAAGAAPPPGAELRVRGETVLRPAGREAYLVDQRLPAPLPPAAPDDPPLPAPPDRRRELPALRVEVTSRLEITRVSAGTEEAASASWPSSLREDRLTWLVVEGPGLPWILSWEGTVETRRGAGPEMVHRSAFVSRALQRLEEPSLDAPGPAP